MSLLVDDLTTQAARRVSNPDKNRVTPADWLDFYNAVARDIGARLFAVRYISHADIQADTDYDYPDEMTRMIKLWTSSTPDDPDSWSVVNEIREDEFNDLVNRRYPTGQLPEKYLPWPTLLRVVPRPTEVLVSGLKLEYWGLPDRIANLSGTIVPLPDFMEEWLVEGMAIHGLRKLKEIAEANDRYKAWEGRENDYAASLTDRADDRRAALRPRSLKRSTGGMV